MTEGEYGIVDPADIVIDRANRQRRELQGIEELAASIQRTGLIHAPIVDRDTLLLRTGERRITAIRQLGWTSVTVKFSDTLSDVEAALLELEENVVRLDLTWQDECVAVWKYHNLCMTEYDNWTETKTAEALNRSVSSVSERCAVAQELVNNNERVLAADKYSVARGIVERQTARKKAAALDELDAALGDNDAPTVQTSNDQDPRPIQSISESGQSDDVGDRSSVQRPVPLLHASFLDWAPAYGGPRFNLIHCDFPYGVGAGTRSQGSVSNQLHGSYKDTADVYWELLHCFLDNQDGFISPSAHCVFWFSMDYYVETRRLFLEHDWVVNPFPFVWLKTDNAGILPDPKRTPRRIYETALLLSRGDRFLVGAKANAFGYPGRSKTIHMSEKPKPMLSHLLSMYVDDTTRMLDPTCGSANAVRVAQDLGASHVFGLEQDEDFFKAAREHYYNNEEDDDALNF